MTNYNLTSFYSQRSRDRQSNLSAFTQLLGVDLILEHSCSVAKSCPTLCDPMQHARLPCLSLSPGLLRLMSIELVMPSKYFILCYPLLLLPSIFPSLRVFFNESALRIRWSKYWSFTFSVRPSFPVNIQGWFPLGLTGLISLLSKGLSRVFSSTTVRKHQFFSAQASLYSNSHIHTWLLEKP